MSNFFLAEPDQARWYAGESDLAATVWLARHADDVHLHVAVTDDQHVPGGDQLLVVLQPTDGTPPHRFELDGPGAADLQVPRQQRRGQSTIYHLRLPPQVTLRQPHHLNLRVIDADGDVVKQRLDLGNVEHPSRGPRVIR